MSYTGNATEHGDHAAGGCQRSMTALCGEVPWSKKRGDTFNGGNICSNAKMERTNAKRFQPGRKYIRSHSSLFRAARDHGVEPKNGEVKNDRGVMTYQYEPFVSSCSTLEAYPHACGTPCDDIMTFQNLRERQWGGRNLSSQPVLSEIEKNLWRVKYSSVEMNFSWNLGSSEAMPGKSRQSGMGDSSFYNLQENTLQSDLHACVCIWCPTAGCGGIARR